jgi:hypothetical protein
MLEPTQSEGDTGALVFNTTHWSVVLSAGRDNSAPAAEALAKLCRTYWWPLYAFGQRQRVCRDSGILRRNLAERQRKEHQVHVKVEGAIMTQIGIGNPYNEVWKRVE